MKRYCLAVDLKDDPALIAKYEEYHRTIKPGILASIRDAGITGMDIYRTGNRLFMIMETTDDFSFETKEKNDLANPQVQVWEQLMWTFQQALPHAKAGEKWILMNKIFEL